MNNTPDAITADAARAYMGEFAWPTIILGVVVSASYVTVPLLVLHGALSLWAAMPLMIVLTYAAYTVMHEAAHGSINGSHGRLRWLNELMGYLAGQVLMIPLTAHRHEHLAHHRHTNDPDNDPDHVIADMTRSPWHAVRSGLRVIHGNFSFYLRNRWARSARKQNLQFCAELVVALAWRLAILAQGFWLEGAALFLVGTIGGTILLMYLFAYVVHRPHKVMGRYVDTSTFHAPGPAGKVITALWGYQNYHAIHHLFPRVPFYRYRSLFDEIEEVMRAQGAPVYELGTGGKRVLPGATAFYK